ncbi:MAG: type III-A CRISPR-associated protein Csm2 [Bacteroides pyogenes]|jgi:CRISPR-associated protein Csm2|uniref:type III-A CRISPR-associated protein Csm2 n=1 Tax=Bacteroides pyogenes TaxID=310300 RepID=UPI002432BBEB|nr:type III-A CRISPR-associated protein Csm2 [Bacteroides pyogenes]MCI7069918.1 type III-A CRISPR-associated protein Csm2 [Bacteroides pyogenes]
MQESRNPKKQFQTNEEGKEWLNSHPFTSEWITDKANPKMISFSEEAGKFMAKNGLTNSKIRSIYGEIKRIQMVPFEKEQATFLLLRPKVAYAYGRDQGNKGLQLFKLIFDEAAKQVNDQKSFNNFCNLFEAILAYHKANGGKD